MAHPEHHQKGCYSSVDNRKIKRAIGMVRNETSITHTIRARMKTYNNLFPKVYDFDSLYRGHLKARKGKRESNDVLNFESDLEGNLIQIQNELMWDEYETGPYKTFYVREPKRRLVAALSYRDRVVQHSLVSVLEPIFEPRFIYHSYACRTGKGLHGGAKYAQECIRKVRSKHGVVYCLKADVSRYFASIDQDLLIGIISKRITCKRTIALCSEICSSWREGLPIGNLTSQLWANIYLNELDQFVKNVLREKMYARYMDDFIIIHHDKSHLHSVRKLVENFVFFELGLKLNNKTQVFPISKKNGRGLDFLGYKIWDDHKRLRKDSVKRMSRRLKIMQKRYRKGKITLPEIRNRIASWNGHASHADSYRIRSKLFNESVFTKGHNDV